MWYNTGTRGIFMDIINTELIVMSLLGIGFDKVDSMLLALVTGKIILDCKNTGFK